MEQMHREKRGEGFCRNLGGECVNYSCTSPVSRCQILRLKCTKFDFGWGSAPDPAGGANSAPTDPLAGFKGAYTSKGESGGDGREK